MTDNARFTSVSGHYAGDLPALPTRLGRHAHPTQPRCVRFVFGVTASARASSMGGGTAPQAQSSQHLGELTIRVAINRNAEALHDAANLAK
jgi:hypothetical protein